MIKIVINEWEIRKYIKINKNKTGDAAIALKGRNLNVFLKGRDDHINNWTLYLSGPGKKNVSS